MKPKLLKKLKFIRVILLIILIGSLFFIFFQPLIQLFIFIILAYCFLYKGGSARETVVKASFFALSIPPVLWMISDSGNAILYLIFAIAALINAFLFLKIGSGKKKKLRSIKIFIIVLCCVLVVGQSLIINIYVNNNYNSKIDFSLDVGIINTFYLLAFLLSCLLGLLTSLYSLFHMYIVYQCLDPEFYDLFVKVKPEIAIKRGNTESKMTKCAPDDSNKMA